MYAKQNSIETITAKRQSTAHIKPYTTPSTPRKSPRNHHAHTILMVFIASVTIFLSFSQPAACKAALLVGYETCVSQLLFALFPFLIAANLLVLCDIAPLLARPFQRLFHCLGFTQNSAAAIFMLALLGGFAPAVSALSQSVAKGKLSRADAARLLPAVCFLGPSYIIVAVGAGMLNNLRCGIYLFVSQVLASLGCVAIANLFQRRKAYYPTTHSAITNAENAHILPLTPTSTSAPQTAAHAPNSNLPQAHTPYKETSPEPSISHIIGDAFFTFLRLCGVILYFQFLAAGISAFLPTQYQWLCQMCLEVTAACSSIAALGYDASLRCCAALSLLSASILLQIIALCPAGVSCKSLLYSRILHLPLALGIFRLLLLIPQTQAVYSSLPTRVISMPRLPLDQAMLLFIAFVFLAERLRKPLQRR